MTTDRAGLAHLRHELRTPLNHIIGYSEMLLEEIADGGRAGLAPELRRIHEHARGLLAARGLCQISWLPFAWRLNTQPSARSFRASSA